MLNPKTEYLTISSINISYPQICPKEPALIAKATPKLIEAINHLFIPKKIKGKASNNEYTNLTNISLCNNDIKILLTP